MLIAPSISSNRSLDKKQFNMKFLLIVACLVLYVAYTCGQRCNGLPRREQNCVGGKDEGNRRSCRDPDPNNEMWWFNERTRECLKMRYLGCDGNRNRYCTRDHCLERCRRRN